MDEWPDVLPHLTYNIAPLIDAADRHFAGVNLCVETPFYVSTAHVSGDVFIEGLERGGGA